MAASLCMIGQRSLATQWAGVVQAVAESCRAPLSARHTLRAAVQIDHLSDVVFPTRSALAAKHLATAADFPAFRKALRTIIPALGPIMDLTGCSVQSPRLELREVEVARGDFPGLPVADLMVSLYNKGRVPQLLLVQPDGEVVPMQDLLRDAVSGWSRTLGAFR